MTNLDKIMFQDNDVNPETLTEKNSNRLYRQIEPKVGTDSLNHLKNQGDTQVNWKNKIRVVGCGKTQATDKYLPSKLWLTGQF